MLEYLVGWFKRFWDKHGDRIFWATVALTIAVIVWNFMDMRAEAKTVIIGVMMLAYNKIRTPDKEETTSNETPIKK